MSLLAIPFPNFVNGTAADATQVDANNAAIILWANGGIDNTNIGAAGIFASQIKPTTGPQAVFGGALGYTFPNPTPAFALTVAGLNQVTYALAFPNKSSSAVKQTTVFADNTVNARGIVAEVFAVTSNNAGGLLTLDTSGNLGLNGGLLAAVVEATALGTFSAPAGLAAGDVVGQRGISTGALILGGATTSCLIDFGVTTAAQLTIGARVNSTGAIVSGSATAGVVTAGDHWASRGTSTGAIALGGSVASGLLDFGVTHAGTFTLSNSLAFASGSSGGVAQVWVGNDQGSPAGLDLNVPTGSVNGFTFLVNNGAVARIDRFGNIFPGNPSAGVITGPYITTGTGSPNGVVTAANGSIFLRFDGGTASLVLYVNNSGASTSGTTWTAVTVP